MADGRCSGSNVSLSPPFLNDKTKSRTPHSLYWIGFYESPRTGAYPAFFQKDYSNLSLSNLGACPSSPVLFTWIEILTPVCVSVRATINRHWRRAIHCLWSSLCHDCHRGGHFRAHFKRQWRGHRLPYSCDCLVCSQRLCARLLDRVQNMERKISYAQFTKHPVRVVLCTLSYHLCLLGN